MTDAEIVRAAAEARGWRIEAEDTPRPGHSVWKNARGNRICGTWAWNPLASDADAMGLVEDLLSEKKAVWIYCTFSGVEVAVVWEHLVKEIRATSPDRRRAIVLAYLRTKGVAA